MAEVTNLEKKQGNSPASDASVFGLIKKAVLRRVRSYLYSLGPSWFTHSAINSSNAHALFVGSSAWLYGSACTTHSPAHLCTQQQQDAAAQFRDGARTDLAEKEEAEAALLSNFLPPPLTADEIERFLSEAASSVLTSISAAQPGGGSKAVVNNQALVGKTLKAFWANVPAGSAVSLSNDDLLKRIKALLEEQGL